MDIESIDHLYAETRDWEGSVRFWRGLGFEFTEQWGSDGHRAGSLACNRARVVLAEVGPEADPAFNVFLKVDDPSEPGPGVEVVTPPEETHWGTRWMRVRDPDGRVYSLQQDPGDA